MQRNVATSVLEEIRKNGRTLVVRSFFFFYERVSDEKKAHIKKHIQ